MSENEDFGLRDVDYKPVDREQQVSDSSTSYQSEREVEKSNSKAPIIIGLIMVALLAFGAYYFFSIRPAQQLEAKQAETELARKNLEAALLKKKKAEEAQLEEQRVQAEVEQLAEEAAAAATPEIGTITVLSARTGKSYLVAGSFFDRDQAMDYGNKVAKNGVSSYILEPTGKVKFYRLGIAVFDSFREASNNVPSFQGEYGDQIWVLKY